MSTPTENIERKLDAIAEHLQRMDNRDRWRTFGGFLRGIIALIPVIILVWSTWYFIMHGEEIMNRMIEKSTSAAMDSSKATGKNLLEQLTSQYGLKK